MSELIFAHVSDLHLPFHPVLGLRQRFSKRQLSAWSWKRRKALHRPEILEALVRDVQAYAVDQVLVTGDVVNFSLPGEFRQAARWLEALAPAERISLVPGNHDALRPVAPGEGLELWERFTRQGSSWPFVHRLDGVSLIGLNSALPTAPLLAQGRLGEAQLARLDALLAAEGEAGRLRIVMLHHPAAAGAIGWRKSLVDRPALAAVLRRQGAELLLHGHARDARLDAIPGPNEPIPCLCVPSSSALPNPQDQGARWHRLHLRTEGTGVTGAWLDVQVRRWSTEAGAFVAAGGYALALPSRRRASGENTQS